MRSGPAVLFALICSIPSGVVAADSDACRICSGIDTQLAALTGITMREEITRYVTVGGKTRILDNLDGTVEISDGVETFEPRSHNGRAASGSSRAQGAWSFGDFFTLLRISREALESPDVKFAPEADSSALEASFAYPASSARWYVAVNSRMYWLDFEGQVLVSPDTGEVLRISWISAPPAGDPDIRQIRRTVVFAPARLGDETRMVPSYAEYRVLHAGNKEEWNAARFSEPARYASIVSVKYDEASAQ